METIKKPLRSVKNFLRDVFTIVFVRTKSRDELHKYWKNPDQDNVPELYINQDQDDEMLKKFMRKYAVLSDNILEIGCNVGRNLNVLFTNGYKNLNAVEISANAIALLKKTYPEMAAVAKINNSPVEEIIKNFGDNSFDVIFTMAVLEHIHPDSNWIFKEMVRASKKYIITIEDEKPVGWRHFRRNYKNVFESLGMKQVESFHSVNPSVYSECWVRVFKKI